MSTNQIYAITDASNIYPAFINVSRTDDGLIRVTVRSEGNSGRDIGSMDLTPKQMKRLAAESMAALHGDAPTPAVTDAMVSRFLSWQLPQDFAPDAGVSFNPRNGQLMPTGTNLLHAGQARAMLEHVMGDAIGSSVNCAVGCGRNESYEGLFDGESEEQRAERLMSVVSTAPDPRPNTVNDVFATVDTSANKQLGDQVSKAPSLTPADIEALVSSEHYFTATHGVHGTHEVTGGPDGWTVPGPLNLLTFCVLVLRNGHTVTGESFCADPDKFSAETGRVEARKVAINKLWPMAVYAERERLKNTAIIELKDHPSEADMAIFKAYWGKMTKGGAS